ncbi:helix-turn-helix transcriptional regulator [Micromonospora noduli]|nr:helix-turn-helix transcriptional regulator [Micromonospora noduli]
MFGSSANLDLAAAAECPFHEGERMEHTSPSSSAHSAASQRFRRELRDCRVQRGLTQRALADLVRFSRETVAAVESGRRFGSHEFALRCDDVLGTGGRLAALWPQVAAEQLAADGRRGPRAPEPARLDRQVPRQRGRRDARDPGAVVDAIDELRELIGQVLNGQPEADEPERRHPAGPLDHQR